eukprot:TRINITY_DN3677_c0_g1_i4.p1 TRINITY_DN3677_c0_g1~~TRINITY_DN3677_c0_g1_i4.p1  ORF type:complete len:317 (-),score=70.15 TRINITY_DN3677_c0_g1_i4:2037-2987(-)
MLLLLTRMLPPALALLRPAALQSHCWSALRTASSSIGVLTESQSAHRRVDGAASSSALRTSRRGSEQQEQQADTPSAAAGRPKPPRQRKSSDEAIASSPQWRLKPVKQKAPAAVRITPADAVSGPEPELWREQLAGIRAMRVGGSAAVDEHGAQAIMQAGLAANPLASPADVRFQVLLSGMLSSQTRDEATSAACRALAQLCSPLPLSAAVLRTKSEEEILDAVRPVSFYKTKAARILQICDVLLDQYSGDIPPDAAGLLALPGVGPKVMTLVMDLAWQDSVGICVDTHVHRISNRSPSSRARRWRRGCRALCGAR